MEKGKENNLKCVNDVTYFISFATNNGPEFPNFVLKIIEH